MFNLLPEKQKKDLAKEYARRRALVYLIGAISIVALSLALLVPSYIVSSYKQNTASTQYESISNNKDISENEFAANIKKVNNLVSVLKGKRSVSSVLIIKSIVGVKPAGVKLNYLGYNEGNTIKIQVQGVASNRESLRNFTKALGEIKGFKVDDLPISEFVKDSNIPFSISIMFTPQ